MTQTHTLKHIHQNFREKIFEEYGSFKLVAHKPHKTRDTFVNCLFSNTRSKNITNENILTSQLVLFHCHLHFAILLLFCKLKLTKQGWSSGASREASMLHVLA